MKSLINAVIGVAMLAPANAEVPIREQLLKLANDLPYFARSSKPVGAILAEARARLQQIEQTLEPSEPFNRITAEELASGNFDLTYLIDGVLAKDQPAGLVAPKKSLKTNISIDLAISLATGGKFLGYFRVAEPKRMAVFSGESGMDTIRETSKRRHAHGTGRLIWPTQKSSQVSD